MKAIGEFLASIFHKQDLTDPRLLGTWQSSGELSATYNNQHGKATKPQMELLEQTFGILKLTYDETMVHSHGADPLKITINGKLFDWVFDDHKYPYEILAKSGNSLKIKYHHPWGKPIKIVLNFVNDNTYWVVPDQVPTTREYFVRVPDVRT